MRTIKSVNPFNEEINWEFELLDRESIDEKINIANEAFLEWKNIDVEEKKSLYLNLANLLEENYEEIAKLETLEMWMLYAHSKAWIKKSANLIRWFVNNFEEVLNSEDYETEWVNVRTQYDPIGVLFWVAPWNFPFNQVLRAAIPNTLVWNTVVYKHASNVPMCAAKIEELFLQAGFPVWIYQNIFVSSSESEYILSKKEIKWVNLTWWEVAWVAIWSFAWKYLKPSVLELGWNDAFIVCDTNDLEWVAKEAVKARIANNWQKCNSSKRFIVREEQYDDFCNYFTNFTEELVIWDSFEETTQIWPMAKSDLCDEIDLQVRKTVLEWAILLTWGHKIDRKGYFYAPTVLKDVTPDMTSYKEEVFWPVASIIKVKDLDEAIKIANNSDFGLCGCVYWDDYNQTLEVASKIETWMVFINNPAWSKASLPFGWVKKSGYWKENWAEWLKAFTNKKVIVY